MYKIGVNTLVDNILELKKDKNNKLSEKARISGIELHKCIEEYLNSKKKTIPKTYGRKREILIRLKNFLFDYDNLHLLETEKKIFYEYKNMKITGIIDAIFYDGKTIYIVDWKTVYDISDEMYKKYSLVLEIYKKILKKTNTKNNIETMLVLLHEDRSSYIYTPCISEPRTLENILDKEIQKNINK